MDRIMSTSSILLDQIFNASGVDIMVFEPSVLFPPPQLGEGRNRWQGPGEVPRGRWDCPWHYCDICGAKSVYHCSSCYNSACDQHYKGLIIVSDLSTGVLQCKYCLNLPDEKDETGAADISETSHSKQGSHV